MELGRAFCGGALKSFFGSSLGDELGEGDGEAGMIIVAEVGYKMSF